MRGVAIDTTKLINLCYIDIEDILSGRDNRGGHALDAKSH